METDFTDWLCDRLGLPLLWEDGQGGVRANAAGREALGVIEAPTLVAATCALLGSGPEPSAVAQAIAAARSGKPSELATGDGRRLLVRARGPGRVATLLAPAELQQAATLHRRAAATDLAAGVSHELANALGAIAGWAKLARQGTRVEEALELIEKSAESAWSAARKVLGGVSGSDKRQVDTLDLSAFVDEAARLLMPKALRRNVHIRTEIAPGLRVTGDRGNLWSIVWNLATNAVEALPPGGTVRLELRPRGNRIELAVADNGPGMVPEVLDRVFEPYFTTKETGTGLGLAMVKRSVEEMGGHVAVESQPSRGTCFTIELPLASGRQAAGKRSSGVFLAEHLEGRFLIVDDDAALREMTSTALQMRGATVVQARSPSEALAAPGPFDVALIDLMLPEQSGVELLSALRARGAVSHGIIITGTELPASLPEGGLPDAVLRKPFELDDLYELVARALSADTSQSALG